MDWIREENYAEQMRTKVEPYVAARKESGTFERVPLQRIYYEHFHAEAPKGVIVISHGFTESIQKFTESIYYMLCAGYDVWGFDHRGHGRSFRLNGNPYVVHVEHFRDYVEDLHHLVEKLVKPAAGALPLYLYCHSMGGCVGARVIEQYPALFDKAVLSSPMLGLSFGKVPVKVAYIGASMMGLGERRMVSPSSVNEFDATPHFESSCGSSECRYLYYLDKQKADRHLQTRAPSIQWGKEAVKACYQAVSAEQTARIRIPVLLFQAGNDTMVKNSAQDLFASRVKGCELVRIPDKKHELYMMDSDALMAYWEKIFAFLR